MRKGFFLTESEKNRITNLYGGSKIFLLEADTPPPTTKEERVEFSKWMDDKYGEWVSLPNGRMAKSPGTWAQTKPFQSGSWSRAWDKYGDDYTKEKGGNVSGGGDKKWRVWNDQSKKYEGPYTLEELQTKFTNNEITGETYVAHPDVTGNRAMKAKNIRQLEMPEEPLPPSASTASTSSIDYQQVKGTKIERPETALDKYYKEAPDKKTIPGPEDLTYRQKTSQGFIEWAKKNLNTLFTDKDIVKLEGNRIITQDQYGTQRVYDYDDKTQEWKHPNFTTNIQIIAKPETDKQ